MPEDKLFRCECVCPVSQGGIGTHPRCAGLESRQIGCESRLRSLPQIVCWAHAQRMAVDFGDGRALVRGKHGLSRLPRSPRRESHLSDMAEYTMRPIFRKIRQVWVVRRWAHIVVELDPRIVLRGLDVTCCGMAGQVPVSNPVVVVNDLYTISLATPTHPNPSAAGGQRVRIASTDRKSVV